MEYLTFEELTLTGLYSDGTRTGTIMALTDMRRHLEPDERELLDLTASTITKLSGMTDDAFATLDYEDFST